ncbi:MAG TPA: beta-ketoacyl synthase N-terminal-like domain-containing protein, partial [Thermodesulfovibrionales bacterium]|nr:beta-ketoacyl synthase N-terminal-like domain-containing protein [Thermodesulfovibrionales bacterium]
MNKRVVITGLGVVSSIGIGWKEFWNGLIEGRSGISPVSSFDTSQHFTHNGGEVRKFSPEEFIPSERIPHMNRSSQMALSAAKLAIGDAALSPEILRSHTVGVSFGTTLGDAQTIESIDTLLMNHEPVDQQLINQIPTHAAPSVIAREFTCTGPNVMFSTACS